MENRVLKAKKDLQFSNGINFKTGTELEIVQGVIYMQGYPLPMEYQYMVMQLIKANEDSFEDVTRNW